MYPRGGCISTVQQFSCCISDPCLGITAKYEADSCQRALHRYTFSYILLSFTIHLFRFFQCAHLHVFSHPKAFLLPPLHPLDWHVALHGSGRSGLKLNASWTAAGRQILSWEWWFHLCEFGLNPLNISPLPSQNPLYIGEFMSGIRRYTGMRRFF